MASSLSRSDGVACFSRWLSICWEVGCGGIEERGGEVENVLLLPLLPSSNADPPVEVKAHHAFLCLQGDYLSLWSNRRLCQHLQ